MSWAAPLLALLGTIVGASLTLFADRIRWRRDHDHRRLELLRSAYGTYLAALHTTSQEIRDVTLTEHTAAASKSSAAQIAFRSSALNACREQLALLAPKPTLTAGDDAYEALRELRDVVGGGGGVDHPDYQRTLARYQAALNALRAAMRADLGSPALGQE